MILLQFKSMGLCYWLNWKQDKAPKLFTMFLPIELQLHLYCLYYLWDKIECTLKGFLGFFAGEEDEDSSLLILSYPQYCRYRSMLKRLQDKPSSVLTDQFVLALGGIAVTSKSPQIFYCRDTFDHPTLIENESICDEFGESFYSYLLFIAKIKGWGFFAPF